MKATCKLCQAVIETEPDTVFDEHREQREKAAFWNRVAFHIDPRNGLCRVNDQKLARNRFVMVQNDNGQFQRWRLLACLSDVDPKLSEMQEAWRDYLHTITSIEASMPPVEKSASEPEPSAVN